MCRRNGKLFRPSKIEVAWRMTYKSVSQRKRPWPTSASRKEPGRLHRAKNWFLSLIPEYSARLQSFT